MIHITYHVLIPSEFAFFFFNDTATTEIYTLSLHDALRSKRELATWLGDERRIHVVPFGVDRAMFSESPGARLRGRTDWRIPEDAFVVLHVGSTARSEERRVGKECRSRWSPYH